MAELQLPKLTTGVRFPSPAPPATLAQSVERIHGKDEVISSILISGSKVKPRNFSSYGVLFFIRFGEPWFSGLGQSFTQFAAGLNGRSIRSRIGDDCIQHIQISLIAAILPIQHPLSISPGIGAEENDGFLP